LIALIINTHHRNQSSVVRYQDAVLIPDPCFLTPDKY
jgi:hypothetical protein